MEKSSKNKLNCLFYNDATKSCFFNVNFTCVFYCRYKINFSQKQLFVKRLFDQMIEDMKGENDKIC